MINPRPYPQGICEKERLSFMGLLMDGLRLLARSVILVDKQGRVRYIQVVPEMTHMPDMEEAFRRATQLAAQK